ncbi:MAG: cation diffusion facilitator family transporter, partial [Pseudomonadales bacterium]
RDESVLKRAFFLIALFMVVELIAGLWTNALVLIADAGHMFLDAAALGLSWWAARISARGFDHKRSYGYHRFQVLAAFINGLTLVALVVWIALEALTRVANPEPILPLPALAVAAVGLVVNIVAFRWLHGASDNTNVRSAMLHVLGDLLGSVAAILAALAVYFFGWLYADPILALLIVVILGRGAYRVLKESTHILLEGVPTGVDLTEIKNQLCESLPNVIEVHHLHAWALTAEKPLLTLHAQVAGEEHVKDAVADIKRILTVDFGIHHSTIQVELGPCPDDDEH